MFKDTIVERTFTFPINTGSYIQQLVCTVALQLDDEKPSNVESPSATIEVLIFVNADLLLDDYKRQLKVTVLHENEMEIDFAVQKFMFLWKHFMIFWALRAWGSFKQPSLIEDGVTVLLKVLIARQDRFFSSTQRNSFRQND